MTDAGERSIEDLLDELQRESERRRRELREIASQLPDGISRRVLLRSAAADVVGAARNPAVVSRALRKAARTPVDLYRAARHRLRRGRR